MLRRVILNGFKSIKAMDLELRPLNVLIGANGAGKSNLISFFKLLNEMMAGGFNSTSGLQGVLSRFCISAQGDAANGNPLEFEVDNGIDTYAMRLFHAAGIRWSLPMKV